MSVEAILTVITVVLAVAALIPQERAHDLQIRVGTLTRIAAGLGSVLVVYWALLDQIHTLPLLRSLPRPVQWYGWDPATLSLVVILLVAALVFGSYRRRLPVHRVPRLSAAITDVLARRRYAECVHLLENHLQTIARAFEGAYWKARLRERFMPTPGEMFQRAHRQPHVSKPPKAQQPAGTDDSESQVSGTFQLPISIPAFPKPNRVAQWLSTWAEGPRDAAHDIVRGLSLTPRLAAEIAAVNPYLGLDLLRIKSSWLVSGFAEDLARALILDRDSVLYRELRRSENIDANGWPIVEPSEQPFIHRLCDDSLREEGANLLFTFLDAGIDPLRPERGGGLGGVLNGPIGDYRERGRWSSPPFATIYLLEIVAPRVAVSEIAGPLNLYVARTLVMSLLQHLDPAHDVDLLDEWPTPTHYLLYETVSLLVDLVRIVHLRPESLSAVRATKSSDHREFVTLPEQAIEILGSVMYECMKSPKLDSKFKSYLLTVWWRAYSDKYQGDWPKSASVREALVRGGHWGRQTEHHRAIAEALSGIDPIIEFSDAAEFLRASLTV